MGVKYFEKNNKIQYQIFFLKMKLPTALNVLGVLTANGH